MILLSHPEYSFVAMRHLLRIQDDLKEIYSSIVTITHQCMLEHDEYFEWPMLDEIYSDMSSSRRLTSIIANAHDGELSFVYIVFRYALLFLYAVL